MRRKEIEKLSELNDSINSAKDNLVDKISVLVYYNKCNHKKFGGKING